MDENQVKDENFQNNEKIEDINQVEDENIHNSKKVEDDNQEEEEILKFNKNIFRRKSTVIIMSLIVCITVLTIIALSFLPKIDVNEKYKSQGITFEIGSKESFPEIQELLSEGSSAEHLDGVKLNPSEINFDKVGVYKLYLEYENLTASIDVHIVDTTAPLIMADNVNVMLGEEYTESVWREFFYIKDMSEYTVKIETDYIANQLGTYSVKAEATDIYGNKSEKEIEVVMVEDERLVGVPEDTDNFLLYLSKTKGKLARTYVPNNLVDLGSYGSGVLKENVLEEYKKLYDDAKKDGIDYFIVSAYRDYDLQEELFDRYTATRGIEWAEKSSARPGTSEHQTGLTFDVSTANLGFTLDQAMGDMKEGIWLEENAHKYGFIVRYPEGKTDITGYKYEPWHLRYLGVDVATEIHERGITFDEYMMEL